MSCNLGKTRTKFTVNSPVFVILVFFLVENFKLSARTKDARETRDAFLESVYLCIESEADDLHPEFFFARRKAPAKGLLLHQHRNVTNKAS